MNKFYVPLMQVVNVDSHKEYTNKEELAEFGFFVKKVSTSCFAEANNLLQEIKKVK